MEFITAAHRALKKELARRGHLVTYSTTHPNFSSPPEAVGTQGQPHSGAFPSYHKVSSSTLRLSTVKSVAEDADLEMVLVSVPCGASVSVGVFKMEVSCL